MATESGIVQDIKTGRRSRPVVLVVDDRPTTRSLVRSVLEDAGYRIYEAADGYKALAMIESQRPDAILLDIIMPGLDGQETLRRIRERWDEIELPVIMLTVKDTLSDIVATLEMGATDFLSKPINFPILMARLNRHLQRKKLADQIHQMRETLEQKVEFRTRQLAEQGRALQDSIEELRATEKRYSSLYNDTPSLFVTLDADGVITSINRYGAESLGWSADELTGRDASCLFHPNQVEKVSAFVSQLKGSATEVVRGRELLARTRGGEHVWIRFQGRRVRAPGDEIELLLSGEDVNESYQLAERLAYLSGHDELTGLYNRVELMRRLNDLISASGRDAVEHTLCLIDIDQFRLVNDTLGHLSGDRYLSALGRRLGSLLGPADVVARVGGDEFALLLSGIRSTEARPLAERIRAVIESFRVDHDDECVGATASIGVVPILSGGCSVTEIMTQADAACHSAKQAGGNAVHLFKADDGSVERHYGEVRWVSRIRNALDADLFEFYAQRIVPAAGDDGTGALELLLRVRKSDGTYVPNELMISAVEEYHYGLRLDSWVIEHAFAYIASRRIDASHPYGFTINVSGQSLGQVAFINHVLEQFRRHAIAPSLICFEITETAAIGNIDKAVEFFDQMRRLGCRLALDDFGSGLSSYAYLKKIPADAIKIDGSLIKGVDNDDISYAIVESIVRLAGKLGKQTIAEHVETEATRATLQRMGVDMVQGNLICMPQPLARFI